MDEPVELTKSNVQMKRVVLFTLCMVMLYACASTRKTTQSSEVLDVSTEKTESESSNIERLIDTTKTDKKKITITEIEFYPPNVAEPNVGKPDEPPKPSESNVQGVSLDNIGSINKGAIKSIKQTTIEADTEEKGESRESESSESAKSEAVVSNSEKTTNNEVEPAPDPYRWRYIFYILLIALGVLLYLKRVPILNWIKTILSGIRKIF